MSVPPRDDSVSPMTQTQNSSPAHRRPSQRPSILRATSSPQPSTDHIPVRELPLPTPTDSLGVPQASEDAGDYLNGGRPHGNQSPANGPTSPGFSDRKRAKAITPGNLLNIREPSRDDDNLPIEPASPGRRSVQFARTDVMVDPPPSHSRQGSWDDGDVGGRSRSERWISRLKSTLGSAGGIQPPKSPAPSEHADASTSNSPTTSRSRVPTTLEEEGSDADVEESGDEDGENPSPKLKKRKRVARHLKHLNVLTSPSTPRLNDDIDSPMASSRFGALVRRSTMPPDERGGMSEGEGREHLAGKRRPWARGSSWIGSPQLPATTRDDLDTTQSRALGHRRRISDMFGQGGASDGEWLGSPRRPLFGADRKATFGGQRWKQVKNTLRIFGGGRKRIDQFDYYKSAELMAELRAVTPAVVILASMIQRDDRGNKRIPVLLEQLNLRVVDSQPGESGDSDRHSVFSIALEYGSGVSRMRWTVTRTIWEIWQLHLKYKVLQKTDLSTQTTQSQRKRPKQPGFPKKLLNILGYNRKLDSSSDEEKPNEERAADRGGEETEGPDTLAEATAGEATNAEGTASENERRPPTGRKRSRINQFLRRQSSGLEAADNGLSSAALARRKNIEKQRKWVEKYLQEMIHWLMFRADNGRLCNFLELSALGVRLAAEGSFHGKECFLHIQSSKGIDFRRVVTPQKVIQRHSRKWFLVRQNYIAVVESPATMNIYDVYLIDPTFQIVTKKNKFRQFGSKTIGDKDKGKGKAAFDEPAEERAKRSKHHHTIKLYTAERKIKLFSRNQTLIRQFEESVVDMLKQTEWHQRHRFDSFAPVRPNAFAQWLVDGRDYMWNVSRAISMAQDVIYIHDWWLSPELYMRRPACISQKWRLDRLLQKKAKEGVKVFIIIYRNVEQAIPIDSEYTKFSLLNLHDNIMVLRSPNQLKKNQFFYAHHEKVCIVDHDVAFLGGIDLCFGRWDNPQHPLADDRPTGMEDGDSPRDGDNTQLFPGKDYSNPRVLDFFKLNEPYEEMYDRSKVPRMPWHDVAMQVVGQPARDLTRHFVQRWNYLRRERKPTRPTPFLLPPPDANPSDLKALGLSGTCEVQMLRSAGDWSLGLREGTEHSIQSAYVKLIEESDHFVYMENQFFITSTETLNTRVVNRIGDALVERIIRAHENDEDWRCCILIPLMPGFQNTVDQAEGSSVRLIMQFQYRSICRGPNSIFGRLQEVGIEPDDYIRFFSLRQWDHIGSKNQLITEQLYIHAKTIIVDDRVALIGSANINERSMVGNRDSEVACVVRDTDMIWSTMAGEPYQVGRFAHTLRMRLMREHLGLDVDEITEEERQSGDTDECFEADMARYFDEDEGPIAESSADGAHHLGRPLSHHMPRSFNHDVEGDENAEYASSASGPRSSSSSSSSERESPERDPRVQDNPQHVQDVAGYGPDNWRAAQEKGMDRGRDSVVVDGHEMLLQKVDKLPGQNIANGSPGAGYHPSPKESKAEDPGKGNLGLPPPKFLRRTTEQLGLPHVAQLPTLPVLDDTDIGGPPMHFDESGKPTNEPINAWAADIEPVRIDKDCMRDPVNPAFWEGIWGKAAGNNTKIYRRVFHCMPDSEVITWKDYHQFDEYARLFKESMVGKQDEQEGKSPAAPGGAAAAAAGIAAPAVAQGIPHFQEKSPATHNNENTPQVHVSSEDGTVLNEKVSAEDGQHESGRAELDSNAERANGDANQDPPSPVQPAGDIPFPNLPESQGGSNLLEPQKSLEVQKNRERRTTFSSTEKPAPDASSAGNPYAHNSVRRRRRATTKSSRRGAFPPDLVSREEAEELCSMIQGHVVQFPYDWLENEEKDNHWLYQADLLAPKEI